MNTINGSDTILTCDLIKKPIKDIKWIIPEFIAEGMTLFAGRPKIGKSWFLLQMARAVSNGSAIFNNIACDQGLVHYFALEDGQDRLIRRMKVLAPDDQWNSNFEITTKLPAPDFQKRTLDHVIETMRGRNQPRAVMLDSLTRIRPPNIKGMTQFELEYKTVSELGDISHQFGIAIVLVHHDRKMGALDDMDTFSGTLGLSAGADHLMIMKKDSDGSVRMKGISRDAGDFDRIMVFDREKLSWSISDKDPTLVFQSEQRQKIISFMRSVNVAVGPDEIARGANMKAANVRQLLRKLVDAEQVSNVAYGAYILYTPITLPTKPLNLWNK
jgi:RecA-family ATPase